MRPTVLIAILALGLALGATVLGQVLLVPMLEADTSLVDANLARALAEPLALRSAELSLAACVVLATVARSWLRHRAATTLALLAAGIAGADRLGLLPRMQAAWGRVDLVAMRPRVRIEDAQQLTTVHELSVAALLVVLVALAGLASLRVGATKLTS